MAELKLNKNKSGQQNGEKHIKRAPTNKGNTTEKTHWEMYVI